MPALSSEVRATTLVSLTMFGWTERACDERYEIDPAASTSRAPLQRGCRRGTCGRTEYREFLVMARIVVPTAA